MQLLYAILLHDGPPRHSSHPPPLTNSTLSIATATIKTVNNCAIIDLKMMQVYSLSLSLSLFLSLYSALLYSTLFLSLITQYPIAILIIVYFHYRHA